MLRLGNRTEVKRLLSLDEAQLKLGDLRQAMDYEKRHRYIDVQGRKKTFSRFVSETLRDFNRLSLAENQELAILITRFDQYPFMDLGSRMSAMQGFEEFLNGFALDSAQPQRKTLTREGSAPANGVNDGLNGPPIKELPIHEMPAQYLKGVGPRMAAIMKTLGIETVENLLYYFPRRYLDYNNQRSIADLVEGEEVTIIGAVKSVSAYNAKNKKVSILSITIQDETGLASASWFYGKTHKAVLENYKSRFAKGAEVMLSGRVKYDRFKKTYAIDKPQAEVLSYASTEEDAPDSLHVGRIVPVYTLSEGLNLRFFRRAIHQALSDYLDTLADPLPPEIRQKYGMIGLQEALRWIHFPETQSHYQQARARLVFDELFYVQVRLALIRQNYKRTVKGLSLQQVAGGYVEQFMQILPFTLTGAQNRTFAEIKADLTSAEPMYRLLQGDVGSGKTIVALLTLLMAVENGYQGALMAPTEILAEQHYRKFIEWLTPLGLKAGLFVGKTGAKERRELRQSLLNGQIHIAVGTHALIQDDVEFANLGVVVVDEQHRFGVRQRTQLKEKGSNPEMLTMTATPIPRTLAMTVHGDLDVSLLDELPPGRSPIITNLLKSFQEKQAHNLIRTEVMKGRQAYVVFPLIEESETLAAKAATSEAERLQQEVFPDLKVGLLHGKMRPDEKDAVMGAFSRAEVDILVSTTVVEVGVDVPNATVMVIENADRFGLAQLHQLRGRVGRGAHQSYCVLMADAKGEETMKRLGIMCESEDGFYIAEKDLELRGPGEFLGTRQSGLPDFVLADLVEDKAVLEQAREAAFAVVNDESFLTRHPELKAMIYQKTEQTFNVLGSG